jgi:hypothetical protein
MILTKTLEQYNDDSVIFCEAIKNNVMNDSHFIRILYSNEIMTLSGIYLVLCINDLTCEKYYNKYKCSFNTITHLNIIEKIKMIEKNILLKLNLPNKTPQFKIYEQLKNGNIKIFHEIPTNIKSRFVLKISGLWETQYSYGLTYKFVFVNNSN